MGRTLAELGGGGMVIQTLQDARSLAEKKKWRANKISGYEGKRPDAQVKRRD